MIVHFTILEYLEAELAQICHLDQCKLQSIILQLKLELKLMSVNFFVLLQFW